MNYPTSKPAARKVSTGRWIRRSLLTVFLLVLLIRLFIFVPIRVVSDSMLPTLHVNDLLLVNKTCYGLRLPFSNKKILETGLPQRGDIVLFIYPLDRHQVYLKRVIGLPGDVVLLKGHYLLSVNGKKIVTSPVCIRKEGVIHHNLFYEEDEKLFDTVHGVLFDGNSSVNNAIRRFDVPDGKYFVLGDNRDHSFDSRSWGFVPVENLIGRPFILFFSWDWARHRINWPRLGMHVH